MTDRFTFELRIYSYPDAVSGENPIIPSLEKHIKKTLKEAGFKRISLKLKEACEI